eukprot:g63808.t1
MTEAVDELVGALTSNEFQGKLLVILAGYEQDMEDMLNVNPGLKSRFAERIKFENLDAHAVIKLVKLRLKEQNLEVSFDLPNLLQMAQRLASSKGFGNGRDVVTWAQMTYQQIARSKRSSNLVQSRDLQLALCQLLSSRELSLASQSCAPVPTPIRGSSATTSSDADPSLPSIQATAHASASIKEADVEPEQAAEDKTEELEPVNPFLRVNSAVLATLQTELEKRGLDTEDGVVELSSLLLWIQSSNSWSH